jgi:hypothetical protein
MIIADLTITSRTAAVITTTAGTAKTSPGHFQNSAAPMRVIKTEAKGIGCEPFHAPPA